MNEKEHKFKIDPEATIKHNDTEYNFKDLVNLFLKSYSTINHRIYRNVVKKIQRKYFRQQNALKIEQLETNFPRVESRPTDCVETQLEKERVQQEYENKLWLEREKLAQIEWKAKKEREDRILQKAKEKEKRLEDLSMAKKKQKIEDKFEDMAKISKQIITPVIDPGSYFDFNRWEKCNYFIKTGVCKYGNFCTKSHVIDANQSYTTLIFPGMYSNMLLGYELLKSDKDSDEALEYEESDIIEHYKLFYSDVLTKFKFYGKVIQFLVCSNYQVHLRGNVYVQFENENQARKAYEELNGRYYAGKKIFCYFSHVKNWKDAVCSRFQRNKCDKKYECNYMHVFDNPFDEFRIENLNNAPRRVIEKNEFYDKKLEFSNKWSSDDETDTSCKENWKSSERKSREKSKDTHKHKKYSSRKSKRSKSRSSRSRSHQKKTHRRH
ncbi:unnamed protein product [Brachionus calyciflorus]|uniref:Uncharacterized protein n=1 Tax=Brachionus calyciflorus TaxID=104777 RepID=A0A814KAE0_9BILA|nr:unnamed protein product [Brachionus calyciflorus]